MISGLHLRASLYHCNKRQCKSLPALSYRSPRLRRRTVLTQATTGKAVELARPSPEHLLGALEVLGVAGAAVLQVYALLQSMHVQQQQQEQPRRGRQVEYGRLAVEPHLPAQAPLLYGSVLTLTLAVLFGCLRRLLRGKRCGG